MRPATILRGSRKRVRAIRWRRNGSLGLWLLVAWVVFLLLVVLPWMVQHTH